MLEKLRVKHARTLDHNVDAGEGDCRGGRTRESGSDERAFDRELGLVHSIVVALCQRMKRSGGRNIKRHIQKQLQRKD